ncbi:MAG: glycosyltransferase, partial [Calditrichaeota bacterium]|nr:glycosyltransferase [Calditrichota bacterium]
MKIGISCYPTVGGSGLIASELGIGLAKHGHEVHFITYAVPGRLNIQRTGIFFHEVTVPDYPLFEYPPYSLALASKIAECVDKHGIELIHAHYAIPHTASALLARDIVGNERLKVVTTLHGTDITLVGRDPSFLPVTK